MATAQPSLPRHIIIIHVLTALLAAAGVPAVTTACSETDDADTRPGAGPEAVAARVTPNQAPAPGGVTSPRAAPVAPGGAAAASAPPGATGPSAEAASSRTPPSPERPPAAAGTTGNAEADPSAFHLDDSEVDYEVPRRQPRARKGRPIEITLRSSPPGAVAAVDGVTVGPTPAMWAGVADGTEREFTFVLPGYIIARYRFAPTQSGVVHGTLKPFKSEEGGDASGGRGGRREPAPGPERAPAPRPESATR